MGKVEFIDLAIERKSKLLIKDIFLELTAGDFFHLEGGNGSGKSSFLFTMLDLLPLSKGAININENSHTSKKAKKCLGFSVNFSFPIMESLTPVEFLNFVGLLKEIPSKVLEKKISELLEIFFEYPSDLKTTIGKLSSGMKQKVSLCSALLDTSAVLVFDEPFNYLEQKAVDSFKDILQTKQQEGTIIILVSHEKSYFSNNITHSAIINRDEKTLAVSKL